MPRTLGFLVVLVLSLASPLLGAGRELGGVQPLAPLTATSTVAAHGSRFLVAWSAEWIDYSAIQFATFDDAGRHGPATTLGFSGGWIPHVVSVDEGFAVVWRDGLTIRVAIIGSGGQVLRGFAVPDEPLYPNAVAAANNRIALVFPDHVLFVDTSGKILANRAITVPSGVVSAATFIGDEVAVVSPGLPAYVVWVPVADGPVTTKSFGVGTSAPAIAPAGNGILAVWQRSGALYAALVTRSGSVTLSGPLAKDFPSIGGYALAQTGTGYVFAFVATGGIYAMKLDGAGAPAGPLLNVFKINSPFTGLSLAVAPSRALIAVGGAGVLLENAFDLSVMATETVAEQPPVQSNLALASNHLDFLAAFTEGAASSLDAAAAATLRFDGTPAGTPQDLILAADTPFLAGQQSVAFGGNVYAHVAHEGLSIVLRRFDLHGALIDAAPIVIAKSGGVPAVASDGTNFFVAWSSNNLVQGAFVTPAGEVGPVRTVASITQTTLGEPRIAFDGTRFVVTFTAFFISGFPYIVSELPIYAVAMTRDGAAGQPVQLFETQQLAAPVASSGTDFLVVGTEDNELLAWSLVADGTSLRVARKLSFSRGLDVAASVTWNGAQYVVAWRGLGPSLFTVDPAMSFLALTHVRTDGSFDPITAILTGTYHTIHPAAPAVAADDLGVELIAIDEIGQPGGSPRAFIYRSDEVATPVVPPAAPIITGARVEYDGSETVTWKPASGNERGYIITAGARTATLLAGTATQLNFPKAQLPLAFRVQAWNEAGTSEAAVFTLLPSYRLPGLRR